MENTNEGESTVEAVEAVEGEFDGEEEVDMKDWVTNVIWDEETSSLVLLDPLVKAMLEDEELDDVDVELDDDVAVLLNLKNDSGADEEDGELEADADADADAEEVETEPEPAKAEAETETKTTETSESLDTAAPEATEASTAKKKSSRKKKDKSKDKDKESRSKDKKKKKEPKERVRKRSGTLTLEEVFIQNMDLISALCEVTDPCDLDELTSSLFVLFAEKKRHMKLLRWAISFEVARTTNETTLFRGNSFVTKLISLYCKHWGLSYLFRILDPSLEELCCDISTFELDPQKAFIYEDLEANKNRLVKVSSFLLENIFASVDYCPMQLRMVFDVLRQETIRKFPAMTYRVLGGFFFLRFVCPALVAPDGYFEERKLITEKGRRSLVLTSKLLQNIANELTFNEKEAFMMVLNPFIEANIDKLHEFYDALVSLPPNQEFPQDLTTFKDLLPTSVAWLSRHLVQHRDSIAELLIHHQRLRTILERSTARLPTDSAEDAKDLKVKQVHQLMLKEQLHKELSQRREEITRIRSERRLVRVNSKLMHAELIKASLRAAAEREEAAKKQEDVASKKKPLHSEILGFGFFGRKKSSSQLKESH